jgi:hypothetical protein
LEGDEPLLLIVCGAADASGAFVALLLREDLSASLLTLVAILLA